MDLTTDYMGIVFRNPLCAGRRSFVMNHGSGKRREERLEGVALYGGVLVPIIAIVAFGYCRSRAP